MVIRILLFTVKSLLCMIVKSCCKLLKQKWLKALNMKLKQTFSNHPSGKYSSLLSKINTFIFLPKFCNFNNSYINDYYLGVFTSLITIQQYIIIKVFICKNGSSHRRCSVKTGVLRSFTKFAGKYVCQSLFLIKVQALACNIIKN